MDYLSEEIKLSKEFIGYVKKIMRKINDAF